MGLYSDRFVGMKKKHTRETYSGYMSIETQAHALKQYSNTTEINAIVIFFCRHSSVHWQSVDFIIGVIFWSVLTNYLYLYFYGTGLRMQCTMIIAFLSILITTYFT